MKPFPYKLTANLLKTGFKDVQEFVAYAKELYDESRTLKTVYAETLRLLAKREAEIKLLKEMLDDR